MPGTAIADTDPDFTLTYNGIVFGPLIKSEVNAEPVPDDAGRATKFTRYTLTVHSWVHASTVGEQESNMNVIHDALEQSRGTLVIEGLGFDTRIDTGANTPDMDWGPRPKVLSWKSLGHICAEVVWSVEFSISRCATAGQITSGARFSAFNYGVAYSQNAEGIASRTIAGYYEVPGVNGANADAMWEKIVAAVPAGFRRENVQRFLSPNKTRMDFTFTDVQLPGEALPPGVINADGRYRFQNATQHSSTQWIASLDAAFTVAPGLPNALAGRAFIAILASKLAFLRKTVPSGSLVFRNFSVEHRLFSRQSSFSCQFSLTACLHDLLSATGVWSPLPESNYQQWATSMRVPWANRGAAGLKMSAADDRIVDACASYPVANIGRDTALATVKYGSFSAELLCPEVTEATSWLAYDNRVRAIYEQQALLHRFAQSFEPSSATDYEEHVLQYQGAPDRLILMQGHAARLKFQPEPPKLTKVAGLECEMLAANVKQTDTPVAGIFDCPLHLASWAVLYRVKGGEPNSMKTTFDEPRPSPDECDD